MNTFHERKIFVLMHGDTEVLRLTPDGEFIINRSDLVPYNLQIYEANSIVDRTSNLQSFDYWCSIRLITLDRKYAKEILNSLGVTQNPSDADRAKITRMYHCLSLIDLYWVKEESESIDFSSINLYDNHLNNAFVTLGLRGKSFTITNAHLIASDLNTAGTLPKAWIRCENGTFKLYKGGDRVGFELLASKVMQCFDVKQVKYEEELFDGEIVSSCKLITSKEKSIVDMDSIINWCFSKGFDWLEFVLKKDRFNYHKMNVMDYLIGNIDRHFGNWGFFCVNGILTELYPLMDFDKAFLVYDDIDGARCLTTNKVCNQREAAIESVKKVGLNQISEVKADWFPSCDLFKLFDKRLNILKNALCDN